MSTSSCRQFSSESRNIWVYTLLFNSCLEKNNRNVCEFLSGKLSFHVSDNFHSKMCSTRLRKDIYMKLLPLCEEMNLGDFSHWMYDLPEWLYVGKTRPKSDVQCFFFLLLFLLLLHLETTSSMYMLHKHVQCHHIGNSLPIPEM